jgi:hypothetical protein
MNGSNEVAASVGLRTISLHEDRVKTIICRPFPKVESPTRVSEFGFRHADKWSAGRRDSLRADG